MCNKRLESGGVKNVEGQKNMRYPMVEKSNPAGIINMFTDNDVSSDSNEEEDDESDEESDSDGDDE